MTYVDEVLADSPVAYWRLDDLTDEVGGFTLTQMGSPLSASSLLVNDPVDGARNFTDDTTQGFIRASDPLLKLTPNKTIEAWVNFGGVTQLQFVQKGGDWRFGTNNSLNPRFRVDTTDGFFEFNGPAALSPGTVYHLVATVNGTTVKVYVNGAEVLTGSFTGSPTGSTGNLAIGTDPGILNGMYGVVDEVAIYNTTLSPARILAHYNAGLAAYVAPPQNTVAPALTGPPALEETLAVSNGTWINNVNSYTYKWQRNAGSGFVDIAGETASTYATQPADLDALVRAQVIAHGNGGNITANSNQVTIGPAADLDVEVRLSGGSSNGDPALSIGGVKSSVFPTDSLLDDVTQAQALTGDTEYRCVYVHNNEPVASAAVKAYFSDQPPTGTIELYLGVAVQAAGTNTSGGSVVTAIANDHTAPAGVTFSTPNSSGTAVNLGTLLAGQGRGLWIKRIVPPGTDGAADLSWQVTVDVVPG
jgi:hypothetical protein